MFQLVVGTNNAKKLIELRLLLPQDRVKLLALAEIEGSIDVDETGATFAENAALKATEQAKHL
ncbi:non-canonical purine NTP pyrophosphatase, partial [Novipirellula sp.]